MSATGGLGVARLDALVALAAERAAAGDGAGARDAYRDAVRIAPARADLWHNLGAFAAAQGDRDEALAALAEAARLHDRWAEPWHARGHVLFAAGDFERQALRLVNPVCENGILGHHVLAEAEDGVTDGDIGNAGADLVHDSRCFDTDACRMTGVWRL